MPLLFFIMVMEFNYYPVYSLIVPQSHPSVECGACAASYADTVHGYSAELILFIRIQ